jgi:hypothetical protein
MPLTTDFRMPHLVVKLSASRVLRSVVIGVTAISALAIAQPALAYTELGTTGTVGAHKLQDTKSDPGAGCSFKQVGTNQYRLTHIYVFTPFMKGVPGMGEEHVAWSFTVQRRIVRSGGAGPWQDDYTSPKFRSHTDSTRYAGFDLEEGVRVVVPFAQSSAKSANYRVIVKLFWYKSDGTTILGTATDRVDWYLMLVKSVPSTPGFCPDYD